MHRILHGALTLIFLLGLYLGNFRGYLALLEEGKTDPRVIYPCKTDTLPPADQQALSDGIPVRSEKELAHLLEDFLS